MAAVPGEFPAVHEGLTVYACANPDTSATPSTLSRGCMRSRAQPRRAMGREAFPFTSPEFGAKTKKSELVRQNRKKCARQKGVEIERTEEKHVRVPRHPGQRG